MTDRGVTMFRRLVRDGVRAVAAGETPKGLMREAPAEPAQTYAHNTVKRMPAPPTVEAERAQRIAFGRDVTERIMRGELRYTLPGTAA